MSVRRWYVFIWGSIVKIKCWNYLWMAYFRIRLSVSRFIIGENLWHNILIGVPNIDCQMSPSHWDKHSIFSRLHCTPQIPGKIACFKGLNSMICATFHSMFNLWCDTPKIFVYLLSRSVIDFRLHVFPPTHSRSSSAPWPTNEMKVLYSYVLFMWANKKKIL